nr:ATP-binding protein [Sphingomonas sp. Y57]
MRAGVDAVHGFCAEAGLDGSDVARLAIIVEELVTNLIEHGGAGAAEAIELSLAWRDEGAVALVLSDGGGAFDPREAPHDVAIPDRGGGAGLNLVRAWASILDYRSEGGRNRMELSIPVG